MDGVEGSHDSLISHSCENKVSRIDSTLFGFASHGIPETPGSILAEMPAHCARDSDSSLLGNINRENDVMYTKTDKNNKGCEK